MKKSKADLSKIKLLILDVDGVLTDGTIVINADGSETKFFSVLDGHGIRMWKRSGLKVVFLSGRFSQPTKHRAEQLEVDYVFQDIHNKLDAFEQMLGETGLSAENIAYVGDDLPDLLAMRSAGFAIAVANASDEIKSVADFITTNPGGKGAVREVIEYIMKNTGTWQQAMQRYR